MIEYTKPEIKQHPERPFVIGQGFPYSQLPDSRSFEELLYILFKQEIKNGEWEGQINEVTLMQGVREKGRDCSLIYNGKSVGLIQCKHSKTDSRLSKNACLKEIIKFLLYTVLYPKLLPDIKVFNYHIAASGGFSEPAINLLDNFNKESLLEIELDSLIEKQIGSPSNKELNTLKYDEVNQIIKEKLNTLKIYKITPQDLDAKLSRTYNENLVNLFFRVRTVTDTSEIQKVGEQINLIHREIVPKSLNPIEIVEKFEIASFHLSRVTNQFFGLSDSHIERKETSQLIDWLKQPIKHDEKGVALLVGNAGYGKTVILRDLYHKLISDQIPVLGIKADKLYASTRKELEDKLGFDFELEHAIDFLKAEHDQVVIVIDQIDALSQSLSARRDYLDTYNLYVESLLRIDGVRVIISARTYDLNYDTDLKFYKNQKSFKVGLLTPEEVSEVLELKGVNDKPLHSELGELLRTPNHLNVFCKIWNSDLALERIRSLHDLYNELWRQKISLYHNSNNARQAIFEIAKLMHDKQKISLSIYQVSDEDQMSLDYLSSCNLINIEENQIQFFHQTFFDYCFAKQFVESEKSLTKYVLNNHQGLFIRASLKMVLSFLRDHNEQDYVNTIDDILFKKKYKFHLKLLVLNELGFRHEPLNCERNFVASWVDRKKTLRNLFLESAYTREWLKFLFEKNLLSNILKQDQISDWVISKATNKDSWLRVFKNTRLFKFIESSRVDNINRIFVLFKKLLPNNRDLIIPFLESCPEFISKSVFVFRLLYFVKKWDHPGAIRLFEKYERESKNDSFSMYKMLEDASNGQLDWVLKTYGNMVSEKLNSIQKRTDKPEIGHSDCKLIEHFFTIDQNKAFDFCLNMAEKISDKTLMSDIDHHSKSELYDDFAFWLFEFERNSPMHNYEGIYQLLIKHTKIIAVEDRQKFLRFYDKYVDSISLTMLKLIVFGLMENPKGYQDQLIGFLKKFDEKQGFERNEKTQYLIRQLIKTSYPKLNKQNKGFICNLLLGIQPDFESTPYPEGGKKRHYLKGYGQTKYKFLSVLPDQDRANNPLIKKTYQELQRKFGIPKDREPYQFAARAVPPPLPTNAYEKMKMVDWEKSFLKYDNESPFYYGPLSGSKLEHSRAFKNQVSKCVDEFAPFIETLIEENKVPQDYIVKGIEGLIQGKYDPTKLLLIFNKGIQLELNRENTLYLTWATDYFIETQEIDTFIVNFLTINATQHSDPTDNNEIDDHLQYGVNTVRGAAASRILELYEFSEYKAEIFNALNLVAIDPIVAVRCSIVPKLAYLMNLDKKATMKLFKKLVESNDVAIMKHTPWSAQYLSNYSFEEMVLYYENAMEHESLHGDLSTMLTTIQVRDGEMHNDLLSKLLNKSDEARSKVIDVAAHFLIDERPDVRERAKYYFLKFKNHTTEKIVQEYSTVFLHFSENDFPKLLTVLQQVSASKAIARSPHYYFEYLLKCCKKHPHNCIDLLEHFDQYEKPDMTQAGYYDDEPVKVLIGSYNSLRKVNDPNQKYLEKSIRLFDKMLKDERFRTTASQVIETVDT